MAVPKYLPHENKVPYNVRLPKKLIDKLSAYAELTGNTTTNVITTALEQYMQDKTVFNDYLEIGGLTLKIPFHMEQKEQIITDKLNLTKLRDNILMPNNFGELMPCSYYAEDFEILKIPNNLDEFFDDSYISYEADANIEHSGIEFFIYPSWILWKLYNHDYPVSILNALYCFYFKISPSNKVNVFLIDYVTAINKLSEAGNEEYKNLLISCVSELENVDVSHILRKELEEARNHDEIKDLKDFYVNEMIPVLKEIAEKYNTGNIIPFGENINIRILNNATKENGNKLVLSESAEKLIDKIVDAKLTEKLQENQDKPEDDKDDK